MSDPAPKRQSTKSKAEELLKQSLIAAGYPPATGHPFHEYRGWEFDFAWPQIRLAIEVDGRGRHQRPKGEREDCEKLNAALEQGWRVLRYPAASVTAANRRERIVDQVSRIICDVVSPEDSGEVLTG